MTALQWGRGLKTPEIPSKPKPLPAKGTLQWGRGLKTPEMRSSPRRLQRQVAASMGPGS